MASGEDHRIGHVIGHAGPLGHVHDAGQEADRELEPRLMPDKPRIITDEDRLRFEGYLAEILGALGLTLDTPGTRATPHRFLRALFDTTAGYEGDPNLLTAFPTECHGGANCEIAQVVEGPIPFFALCEHHALPFFGNVYVGYVAHQGIIGISKLTRLVRVVTRRFGVQERMTYQIADELDRMMAPHGVTVYVRAGDPRHDGDDRGPGHDPDRQCAIHDVEKIMRDMVDHRRADAEDRRQSDDEPGP